MKLNGFIKRAFFFLAAFALGITVTGLLFGFSAPRFGRKHREGRRHYVQQLQAENERLRIENLELMQQLKSRGQGMAFDRAPGSMEDVFAPPPQPTVRHDHK